MAPSSLCFLGGMGGLDPVAVGYPDGPVLVVRHDMHLLSHVNLALLLLLPDLRMDRWGGGAPYPDHGFGIALARSLT